MGHKRRSVTYDWHGKHKIPLVGHAGSFDFTRAPRLSEGQLAEAVRRTLELAPSGVSWLVIFRDPRSVAISSCFHNEKDCPEPDRYALETVRPLSMWIDLRFRFFSALARAAPRRALLLFYEEMRTDEAAAIRSISTFLGLPADEEQVERVRSRTTLDALKRRGSAPATTGVAAAEAVLVPDRGGARSGKVREGAVCGYRASLSPSVAEEVTRQMLAALGPTLRRRWSSC